MTAAVTPCSTPALHENGRCACASITWTDTAAAEAAAVRLGVVTARMLIEQASADWEHWSAATWIGDRLRAEDPRTPLEVLDAGVIDQAAFWAIVNRSQPCACWSCDGNCGGNVTTDDCGLVEPDENGHLLCAACRERADVVDADRQGARVSLDRGLIRLNPDVWGYPHNASLRLTAASARRLAASLLTYAGIVETVEAGQ